MFLTVKREDEEQNATNTSELVHQSAFLNEVPLMEDESMQKTNETVVVHRDPLKLPLIRTNRGVNKPHIRNRASKYAAIHGYKSNI